MKRVFGHDGVINEIVSGISKMLQTLLGAEINLITQLEPDLPHVLADAGHMEQLLANLVVNARDAMPNGGEIIVATRRAGADEVTLTVTDSGTGIEADTLSHIFEPFFTTKEQGKGTGLGLSTVFGIVKQSHGRIEVDTKPGRGTSFVICLPRTAYASVGTDADRAPLSAGTRGSGTVLVLDDDDALRAALVRKLRHKGFHVVEASSGPQAIAIAAHERLDLIVSDVVLPGPSGPAVVKKLRELQPSLPVLFISGYTDTTMYPDVPVAGPTFLQKPFTLAAFSATVRALMSVSPNA